MGQLRYRRFAAAFAVFVLGAMPPVAKADDTVFRDGFEFGFLILTPEIMVAPGEEATYCYYFHTPNTGTMGIRRWASSMSAGTHHMILYATFDSNGNPIDYQPPGTLTQSSCGLSSGSNFASWIYATHNPNEDLVVPPDDGSGSPLAMEIAAGQPAFLQMYVLNTGDTPITTSALLKAEALAPQAAFTRTAAYITYNNNISIGPQANASVQATCATPAGAKFWWVSTRTHKFALTSSIVNSAATVVVNTDWEHPAAATFSAPNFLVFSSGLTYACTYHNPNNNIIHTGDSESSDENCMGIGYFFPAAHSAYCINNIGPL